jgi:hypothetical protein
MKSFALVTLLFLLVGCKMTSTPGLDVTILVGNIHGPFVSREFAERLALLVIEEKYTADVFSVRGAGTVVDKGDFWWVTYDNGVPRSEASIIPRRLTIQIRKANGEIVAIS